MNLFNEKPYSNGKDDSVKAAYSDNTLSLKGFGRGEPKLPRSARINIPIVSTKGKVRLSDSSRGFAGTASLSTGFIKKGALFDKNAPKRPAKTLIEVPYVKPANKAAILRAVKKADGKPTSVLEDKLLRPVGDIDYINVLKGLVEASSGTAKEEFKRLLSVFNGIKARNDILAKRGLQPKDEDTKLLHELKSYVDEMLISTSAADLKKYAGLASEEEVKVEEPAKYADWNGDIGAPGSMEEQSTRSRSKAVQEVLPGARVSERRPTTSNLIKFVNPASDNGAKMISLYEEALANADEEPLKAYINEVLDRVTILKKAGNQKAASAIADALDAIEVDYPDIFAYIERVQLERASAVAPKEEKAPEVKDEDIPAVITPEMIGLDKDTTELKKLIADIENQRLTNPEVQDRLKQILPEKVYNDDAIFPKTYRGNKVKKDQLAYKLKQLAKQIEKGDMELGEKLPRKDKARMMQTGVILRAALKGKSGKGLSTSNSLKMHRGYETHGIYSTEPIRPRLKL